MNLMDHKITLLWWCSYSMYLHSDWRMERLLTHATPNPGFGAWLTSLPEGKEVIVEHWPTGCLWAILITPEGTLHYKGGERKDGFFTSFDDALDAASAWNPFPPVSAEPVPGPTQHSHGYQA